MLDRLFTERGMGLGQLRMRRAPSRLDATSAESTHRSADPRQPPRPHEATSTAKRLDLQGLRAVAVLLVALNHAKVPLLRGGYVGVDVFFVLSGYFITGLLLREGFNWGARDLGRISLRRFYARRARRILPAACLTLLTTSIAVYVVYDLMGYDFLGTKPVLEDAFASSLFFANIHFVATANNYFAQAAATLPSPFQHFWSLSIEEQFYVVWPSLLAGTFYICRRRTRVSEGHPRRAGWRRRTAGTDADPQQAIERQRRLATRLIGLLIASGTVASLIWSIHDTALDPQAAYFSTPVRVWEFGCGAGLALLAAQPHPLPRVPRALLGWVGLAMIAVAAVVYSSGTDFPGAAALLPVVGAGLIILAGMLPTRRGVSRALAVRPLTYIGDRSYAFYLWHYPVLILVWQLAGRELPAGANLGLLAGAFVLSALTYACYENPLRFAHWLRGWRTALMVPVSMSAAVLAALIPIAVFESSLAMQAVASQRVHIAALAPAPGQPDPTNLWSSTPIPAVASAATAARRGAPLPKAIVPSLQELEQENSRISYDIPHGCQPAFGPGTTSKICRLGDSSSKRVVALVGDSHAGMWMPALEADGRAQGFAVVPLDKPGCILSAIHRNHHGWPCGNWYKWALGQDRKLHPLATVVVFQLTPALQARPSQTTGLLQAVLGHVTHGVLLTDPPDQIQQPSECLSRPGANMGKCSTTVPGTYVPFMHAVARMTAQGHYPAIPTLQWFCAGGVCPMIIDHTLATRDRSHLTMEFSAQLSPVLGLELKPILSQLEAG